MSSIMNRSTKTKRTPVEGKAKKDGKSEKEDKEDEDISDSEEGMLEEIRKAIA